MPQQEIQTREEASGISDQTINLIVDEYDVPREILEARKGWFFVGEVGCDYWYAILSPAVFDAKYKFTKEFSKIGKFVERRV